VHQIVVMHCWEDDRVLLAYHYVLGSNDQVNHQNSGWSNHHLPRGSLHDSNGCLCHTIDLCRGHSYSLSGDWLLVVRDSKGLSDIRRLLSDKR
jgi:hypothetical protein